MNNVYYEILILNFDFINQSHSFSFLKLIEYSKTSMTKLRSEISYY